ncbi:MAG: DUF5682 family protein [Actinomycetia bacterium]|nr:DUF5682 family protein [Actinomycetes bacterium]
MTFEDPPPRLARALDLRRALTGRGVWFASIRHHSPACARAVRALIRDVNPAAVLIEGPETYAPLMAALQDPVTRPPVAILGLHRDGDDTHSTLYPLADFSPEWVALREAADLGVPAVFIDAPYDRDGPGDDLARTLQSERYFAHSRTLASLAAREHCRDHDELWEQLFELGTQTAQDLFEQTFVWSSLARLDYEPEVLESDGTLRREATMEARIAQWRAAGPLVVVTGAFHTLALVEALGSDDAETKRRRIQLPPAPDPARPAKDAWLIRYDLTRLDGLRGYGAGIPAPGYYQRTWEAADPSAIVTPCLVDIARAVNAAGTADLISTPEVMAAALQAQRLADLRGHAWPGRVDVLDACSSCFVRGETGAAPAVRDAVAKVFGGTALGVVPDDSPAPPILAEARDQAAKLRFVVTDAARRTVSLDLHRSGTARRRSRFLALMSYLGTGFATKTAGPDFIAGVGLGRLFEEWQYAWTPLVEVALIGLADKGATLAEAATTRLEAAEADAASGRSAGAVGAIVAQAAAVGLDQPLDRLLGKLADLIEQDPSLRSVVAAAARLLGLWQVRDMLELPRPERLLALAGKTLPQIAYLIDGLRATPEEDEDQAVVTLLAVRDLGRQMGADDWQPVRRALARARGDGATSPGVQGALYALAAADGDIGDDDMGAWLQASFGPGADPELTVRRLAGWMRAAPDLLLHTPELFEAVDDAIVGLSPDAFLALLPDLRRCFTWLKPFETAALASRIAESTGLNAEQIATVSNFSAGDLARGVALQRQLTDWLRDDCLESWAEVTHA